jgi:nucleoside-diphosphate kinase
MVILFAAIFPAAKIKRKNFSRCFKIVSFERTKLFSGGSMAEERTFVMIKPDGVKKGLVGEIISRFENKGLTLCELRLVKISRKEAEELYQIHRGKPFFEPLIDYVTSGPVVVMVLEGPGAIKVVRSMVGATDPQEALPGTIRGDYALTVEENIVHASDSAESFQKEAPIFFGEKL